MGPHSPHHTPLWIHPLNPSVTWIVGRFEVLVGLFHVARLALGERDGSLVTRWRSVEGPIDVRRVVKLLEDKVLPFRVRCLEIGPGCHPISEYLVQASAELVFVEPDVRDSQWLQDRFGESALVLPIPVEELLTVGDQGTFDLVVGIFSAHHVEPRALSQILEHILSPGGQFVLVDFFAQRHRGVADWLVRQQLLPMLKPTVMRRVRRMLGVRGLLRLLMSPIAAWFSVPARRHIAADCSRMRPASLSMVIGALEATMSVRTSQVSPAIHIIWGEPSPVYDLSS